MTNECVNKGRLVGNKAPEFVAQALVNGEFKQLSLSDMKSKWKVLFFYPLDFTFVCPTEITAFSDKIDQFKELKTEIIGVSTDSIFSHLAWTKQSRAEGGIGNVKYPLLSDFNKKISRDYGVLIEDEGVALRGLFIIDDQNVIQHSTINNLGVGRNVDEILRLIEAFQYVAKNGEVCPANWSKGQDTMKADPQGSKSYFQKHG